MVFIIGTKNSYVMLYYQLLTVNWPNGRLGGVAQQHVGEETRLERDPLEYPLKMGELHARVLKKKKRGVIQNPVVSV